MERESQPPAAQPELVWKDAGIPGVRADVCQIQSTREEMILLFGKRQPRQADDEEQRVSLERRIILSPVMAKQLAAALEHIAREYEARLGSVDATPAGRFEAAPSPADVPAGARTLLGLVQELKVGFGFEKSFKMSEGSLLGDRLILGVRTSLVEPRALLEVCRRIGMPEAHLAQLAESLPEANTVGFGFEGSDRGGVYKVYLEFWDKLWQRVQREPTNVDPALLFLGFKWDALDNARSAVARYTCYPLLSIKGILRRLAALYDGREDSPSLQATREIIGLAARRIPNDSFVYVEAAEEGNPRKSFDINFYKARLRVDELQPVLSALCRRYSIAAERFEQMDAAARGRPFGHLSGGLGRDGKDFLTAYYEIEAL